VRYQRKKGKERKEGNRKNNRKNNIKRYEVNLLMKGTSISGIREILYLSYLHLTTDFVWVLKEEDKD
jgi:hypothetical protein